MQRTIQRLWETASSSERDECYAGGRTSSQNSCDSDLQISLNFPTQHNYPEPPLLPAKSNNKLRLHTIESIDILKVRRA